MKLKKPSSVFSAVLYAYMALPFFIFSFFMKWYFALPVAAVTAFSSYLAACDSEAFEKFAVSRRDVLKIVGGVIFIAVIVLLSGIGNVLWQNQDHPYRNGIFQMLVLDSWPPRGFNSEGSPVALCYYIGFWLPSAVIGKLTTLSLGYAFQILWAVGGICLIWLLICSAHKKIVLYPLFVLLLFSGLDVIGHTITNITNPGVTLQMGNWASFGSIPSAFYHLEWWPLYYQYSSHTTQLFWVFNQALPVWLSVTLLICEKNGKNLVFIMGLTLLSSTLPFVGLIPFFVWCAFTNRTASLFDREFVKPSALWKKFCSLFTPQNFFGGGVSGIISFLYLIGNIASSSGTAAAASSSSASGESASFQLFFAVLVLLALPFFFLYKKGGKGSLFALIPMALLAYKFIGLPDVKTGRYLLFIALEALVYLILLFPRYGQSSIFYFTAFSLLLIPFFKVGKSIDFCMRASIPALFVLTLLVSFALCDYFKDGKRVLLGVLVAALLCGAVTPAHEIGRTVYKSITQIAENGKIANSVKSEAEIFNGANFTAKGNSGVFFEHLAK